MSGEVLEPDPSAAVGKAVETLTSSGATWLFGQPPIAVFSVLMLIFVLSAGYWTVDHVIPSHIAKINDGYKALAIEYDRDLDKVIDAFKKDSEQHRMHTKEILDAHKEMLNVIREERKPIAVLPQAGSE